MENMAVATRYCNRCNRKVIKSELLEEYSYQCLGCDEDLYGIETHVVEGVGKVFEIRFVKETACIMLLENGKYVDSVFFNKYDYEHENLYMEQVEFESSKLASINNVNEYALNTEEF